MVHRVPQDSSDAAGWDVAWANDAASQALGSRGPHASGTKMRRLLGLHAPGSPDLMTLAAP